MRPQALARIRNKTRNEQGPHKLHAQVSGLEGKIAALPTQTLTREVRVVVVSSARTCRSSAPQGLPELTMPSMTLAFKPHRAQRWLPIPSKFGLAIAIALFSNFSTAQTNLIQVAPLETVVVHPQREVPAQVVARNLTKVATQVGGVIAQWHADIGQRVAKGAILAQIDTTDLQLALSQAQAQLSTAQAQLALTQAQNGRAQKLTGQGYYSQEALNQSETQLQVSQAQIRAAQTQRDMAQRQLSKARITAPFAAEVTQRLAQQGETVAAGTPLFVLSEITAPELSAELSGQQSASLQRANHADLVIGSHRITLPLNKLRVNRSANPSTRTHSMRLKLNDSWGLAPGSSALLRWQEHDAFVPAHLIVRRESGLGVFVAKDGQAVFHPLPNAQEGQPARIDLPMTTPMVTQGQQRLQSGQKLNP